MPTFETRKQEENHDARVMDAEMVFRGLSDADKVKNFGSTDWREVLARKHEEREVRRKSAELKQLAGEARQNTNIEKTRAQIREVHDNPEHYARRYSAAEVKRRLEISSDRAEVARCETGGWRKLMFWKK